MEIKEIEEIKALKLPYWRKEFLNTPLGNRSFILKHGEGIPGKDSIFETNDMVSVGMGEYAVTSAKNSNPILTTVGVGPCVTVYLWTPETKVMSLTHVPAWESPDKLDKFRQKGFEGELEVMGRHGVPEADRKKIEVDIIGGDRRDKLPGVIIARLQDLGITDIKIDVRSSETSSYKIAKDARTGTLFNLKDIIPNKTPGGVTAALRSFYSTEITAVKDPRVLK